MELMEYDTVSDGDDMETSPTQPSLWKNTHNIIQHGEPVRSTINFDKSSHSSVFFLRDQSVNQCSSSGKSARNSFSGFRSCQPTSPQETERIVGRTSEEESDSYSPEYTGIETASVQNFTLPDDLANYFNSLSSRSSYHMQSPNNSRLDKGTDGNTHRRRTLPDMLQYSNYPTKPGRLFDDDRTRLFDDESTRSVKSVPEEYISNHEPSSVKRKQKIYSKKKPSVANSNQYSIVTVKTVIKSVLWSVLFITIYIVSVMMFSTSCGNPEDYHSELLNKKLSSNVYGQHLAVSIIPIALEQYFTDVKTAQRWKPLVISLNGWTGVGKNFVSRIVSEFISGSKVTKFLIPLHFAHSAMGSIYAQHIKEWIVSNVTKNCINFFILDEMDKADENIIHGFNDSINILTSQNLTNTLIIFLLLSNSRASDINKYVFQKVEFGQSRKIISDSDLREILLKSSDQWYDKIKGVIDVFVPFLPLEWKHVAQCVKQDMALKGLHVDKTAVKNVLEEMAFFTAPAGIKYSHTGCKRVSDKVNYVHFQV